MQPMRKSRMFGLAQGVVNGGVKTKQILKRNIYDRIFPYYIEINRIPQPKKYYQEFNLYEYMNDTNDLSPLSYYIIFLLSGIFGGYYFALSLYDTDIRYYMFIRFPEQMAIYDQISQSVSDYIREKQMQYIGEIPDEINSESDYYRFKQQIKDKIFHLTEKKEQEVKQREELKESAQKYEQSLANMDEFLSSQDKQIKSLRHD
ncbi:hypothetical protein PPERSA_03598 [Pseudocohnilembus persalinus]|uniref:Transmembrane protein n=1 Tax=Pseudocohnilembus persalinus TaxID=266149 RepID=A0A0V0QQ60_PSEPJ|nr:hypothetical protein PPERSA_03598 [Pseudocohnilembus persalinus]|eukprot:KRX04358.1 hypothetical protein PPERSA_03598 [Pseudocohnilembus persalinus]